MTFLHKLAKRLAQSHAASVIGLAAIFACELPTKPLVPSGASASRLAVSPKVLTLQQHQVADFTAIGFTGTGDTASLAVSWSVTSGSIIDTSTNNGQHIGRYRAGADTGKVKVVAKGNSGGPSDTAVVTVTLAPVTTVAVSPAAASVTVGQTVQLTATPKDANGNPLTGRTVTWATSNAAVATVSGSGLVSGLAAGSASITAMSDGKSGTASITVTAPVSTNPGTVTDLAVASVTDSSGTLSFTEVSDGTGLPASYDIRFAAGAISWASATAVTRGSCTAPVVGSVIGAVRTCTVLGLQAGTTYEFRLIAFRGTLNLNAVFGGLSNIARAATAPSTAAVATVAISPASASVSLGATQQLSAVVKDANGNVLTGRTVTWTSNSTAVALVSSSGLVTGLALGSATITATSEGKSGTAPITVTSASVGPQPGPTATIIFQDGFESGTLSLWQQIPANGRYSVATDAARVKSGTHSMQALYTPTNTYGTITRWFMPGYDEIYVKFHVMFEEGFDERYGLHFLTVAGNRIDNPSSASGKAGVVPNGTDYFYAGVDPEFINGDAPLKPFHFYTYYPDMSCCYGNRFFQSSPKTPLIAGQWHEVVFHIKLNTPGQYNGSQALWIDGVKKIDVQNMRWRTTTDLTLNQIRFDNYMSAGPKTEYVWVDDLTVWRP
jgi:uncharacterized protein YjdB